MVYYFQSGTPYIYKNAVCIFEQNDNIPLRKHFDTDFEGGYNYETSTKSTSLILRTINTVYNYNYICVRF
jgi:diamine oxidase